MPDEGAAHELGLGSPAQQDEMRQHRGATPHAAPLQPGQLERHAAAERATDRLHRGLGHQPLLAVLHRRTGGVPDQDAVAVLQLDLALVVVPFAIEVHAAEEEPPRGRPVARARASAGPPVVATLTF